MVQLLRPEFTNLLSKQQENDVFLLIGRLIQTLSSPEIAIDDRHTPRLYARFLAGLLTRHRRDGTAGHRQGPPPGPAAGQVAEYGASHSTLHTQPQGPGPAQAPPPPPPPTEGGYTHAALLFGGVENANGAVDVDDKGLMMFDMPTTTTTTTTTRFSPGLDFLNSGDGMLVNNLTEEEMLATMQALKNPAWWMSMAMPGWVGCV